MVESNRTLLTYPAIPVNIAVAVAKKPAVVVKLINRAVKKWSKDTLMSKTA